MPIESCVRPLRAAIFAVRAKCGAGASSNGGDAHEPCNRQPVSVLAGAQESVSILGRMPAFLRLGAGVDFNEKLWRSPLPADLLRQGLAQAGPVHRVNGIEHRHRFLGLVDCSGPIRCSAQARDDAQAAPAISLSFPAPGSRQRPAARRESPARSPRRRRSCSTAISVTFGRIAPGFAAGGGDFGSDVGQDQLRRYGNRTDEAPYPRITASRLSGSSGDTPPLCPVGTPTSLTPLTAKGFSCPFRVYFDP